MTKRLGALRKIELAREERLRDDKVIGHITNTNVQLLKTKHVKFKWKRGRKIGLYIKIILHFLHGNCFINITNINKILYQLLTKQAYQGYNTRLFM